METRIIASNVKSNRSDNYVWAVSITGEEQPKAYCKSPYKAMRFAFLLKKQTGIYIADDCLQKLMQQIAIFKSSNLAADIPQPAVEEVEKPEKTSPKRKKTKKTEKVATLS